MKKKKKNLFLLIFFFLYEFPNFLCTFCARHTRFETINSNGCFCFEKKKTACVHRKRRRRIFHFFFRFRFHFFFVRIVFFCCLWIRCKCLYIRNENFRREYIHPMYSNIEYNIVVLVVGFFFINVDDGRRHLSML